jgi:hypothetical protein
MSINPSDKVVRVGRYRLTTTFARRALTHYSRRVALGEMPSAINADMQSGRYSEAVTTKVGHMVNKLGKAESNEDRAVHHAMQTVAQYFGLPAPTEPRWPKEEKAKQPKPEKQPKQQQPQQPKSPSKPKDKSDEQDEGEDGKGEGDDSDSKEDGQQSDGDGQGTDDESESESDSQGEGQGDGEGEEEGECAGAGDGDGEGESEEEGNAAGRGAGEEADGEADDTAKGSTRGGNGDVEDLIDDEPQELDLNAQLSGLANYHPRDVEPPPPSPITRVEFFGGVQRDEHRFDYGCENQLIARLRAELMSVSRHRKFRDKDTGYVDMETKLVDIATCQNLDRVFYSMTNARRINTAVQLFLDVSGSMGGAKLTTCCALGYLLANTLEKLRVPVQIIAFSDDAYLVKDWHEKVMNCPVKRLSTMGGTHLPNAQSSGLRSLMMRREARKIQAVVTDGDVGWIAEPDAEKYIAQQPERTDFFRDRSPRTRLHKKCPGLETYGFGVGVEIPEGIFNRKVDNLEPRNMVERIVDTLGHVLTRAA